MCWSVGGGEGSCGKRYGGCGGRCREVCWGVGMSKKRCVGVEKCGEGCGKVYGVSRKVCWGRDVGRGMKEV